MEEFKSDDTEKIIKKNILVKLLNKLENFKVDIFKKNIREKKDNQKNKKNNKKLLKDSQITLNDVQQQRRDAIKKVMFRIVLISFIIILIMGAVILSRQDNEKQNRPKLNIKKLMNDTTSFGGIDQKDYFLEQNVLDDKINIVERDAKKGRKELSDQLHQTTRTITEHLDKSLKKLEEHQKIALQKNKKEILKTVNNQIHNITENNKKKFTKIEEKMDNIKTKPRLTLSNGKIIFPDSKNGNTKKTLIIQNSIKANKVSSTDLVKENNQLKDEKDEKITIDMSDYSAPVLKFDTGMEVKKEDNKTKKIEIDLTTSLVRVMLLDGVRAATLDVGLSEPSPVLMMIDGVKYSANDHSENFLNGCFLEGVGIGNINTSRVEIFGTHLSCIFEKEDGELWKIEHDFPKNRVWIKGEDGGNGVPGVIVDSSGKILSKAAAMGFLQGLSNYFSAQNLVTGGLNTVNDTGQTSIAQLGTSLTSGTGGALKSSFDLIIKQYEKLLNGYYPYIDVKGGRKKLTAVFGGKVKLIATPYNAPNF